MLLEAIMAVALSTTAVPASDAVLFETKGKSGSSMRAPSRKSSVKKASVAKPVQKKAVAKKPQDKPAQSAQAAPTATPSAGPGLLGTMAAAAAGSYIGSAIAKNFDSDEEELKATEAKKKTAEDEDADILAELVED